MLVVGTEPVDETESPTPGGKGGSACGMVMLFLQWGQERLGIVPSRPGIVLICAFSHLPG